MKVSIDPYERLLHQILRPLPVTGSPVHEVDQASVVPFHELGKSPLLPGQESRYQLAVVELVERPDLVRADSEAPVNLFWLNHRGLPVCERRSVPMSWNGWGPVLRAVRGGRFHTGHRRLKRNS